MDLGRREQVKEEAVNECIEYGTPTMGVDHGNHYKPIAYPARTDPADEKVDGD